MNTCTDIMTSCEASVRANSKIENTHNVIDVEAWVTIVERQEPIHRQLRAEIVVFPTEHLLSHTGTDLGLEVENRAETEITSLSTLIVLRVLDPTAATECHHTRVDVLVEMQTLLRFRDTSSSVHVNGVQEIRLVNSAGYQRSGEKTCVTVV